MLLAWRSNQDPSQFPISLDADSETTRTRIMKIQYRRELWRLFDGSHSLRIAEIGVAEGRHAEEIMLNWPFAIEKIYLVDRWKSVPDQKGDASQNEDWHSHNLLDAMVRMGPWIDESVFLQGGSEDMAGKVDDGSLDFVYIDADHSFMGCQKDINAWFPKLKPGGYMAFHDFENLAYGVKAAVHAFCGPKGYTIRLIPEDKAEDAGAYFQKPC